MAAGGESRRSGPVGSISLGQIVGTARRYQPVGLAVAFLLIVFALLPDGPSTDVAADDAASLLDATRATSRPSANDDTLPPPSPGIGNDTFESTSPSATDSASFAAAPNVATGPRDSSGTGGGGGGSGSDGREEDEEEFGLPSFEGGDPGGDTEDEAAPLRIVGSTWATRQAGTPLAAEGVPDGTLPVGMRLTEDKLSFIRLGGDRTLLELAEDSAGTRSTNGPVLVQLCQVTDGSWTDGGAIPIDDAPPWDDTKCSLGTRRDDGVWTFDMLTFESPTDPRGFALVPAEGAGVDWQVAFKKA